MDIWVALTDGLRGAFGPQAAAYALLAIGLNVHFGFTGLLNFGQVGFMLVGAYGVAVTTVTLNGPLWLGVLVGLGASIVLALLVGIPTLRLRTDYFAITTIAVAEVLRLIVRSGPARDVTGGPFGLQSTGPSFQDINPIPTGSYGIGPVSYPHGQLWSLIVTWGIAFLATFVVIMLMRSPWGRVIKSIREDEEVARSLGKNVFSYKLQSLMIGGAIGALGGIMFTLSSQTANPDTYDPRVTFFAYTILILGGAASKYGPLLGAVLFWFLYSSVSSALREAAGADLLPDFMAEGGGSGATIMTLIGVTLVLLMVFRPQGLLGNKKEMVLGAR
ncbi:branched-chain amino acid ABC transporter permease [Actinobacteria bacterium YIM 96077]|uniref:Branched-chain amino acid ABC transporter permease n=1 Tax=Phytoactinopolyspora halophila TaxID=1981511 RepID=A0A329QAT7_9ACTN|nr:branched-chain amino acid ABC transporter permease [Phytoactinopolyspora halophila]AYY12890.1 branched-chain amino acid ABC transporter permease [Actinobacteria bacterium YIM 96077]RAW09181.1 branched-chain amino acid ABC transporter permease [Phytoactinopolyspora halophila]